MKKSIKQFFNKTNAIHFLVLTGFILFSVSFFYPVLSGKKLIQSDIQQYSGMSRQIQEYREVGAQIIPNAASIFSENELVYAYMSYAFIKKM